MEVKGEVKELHLFCHRFNFGFSGYAASVSNFPFAPELILRHFDRDSSSYTRQAWEAEIETCGTEGCCCE